MKFIFLFSLSFFLLFFFKGRGLEASSLSDSLYSLKAGKTLKTIEGKNLSENHCFEIVDDNVNNGWGYKIKVYDRRTARPLFDGKEQTVSAYWFNQDTHRVSQERLVDYQSLFEDLNELHRSDLSPPSSEQCLSLQKLEEPELLYGLKEGREIQTLEGKKLTPRHIFKRGQKTQNGWGYEVWVFDRKTKRPLFNGKKQIVSIHWFDQYSRFISPSRPPQPSSSDSTSVPQKVLESPPSHRETPLLDTAFKIGLDSPTSPREDVITSLPKKKSTSLSKIHLKPKDTAFKIGLDSPTSPREDVITSLPKKKSTSLSKTHLKPLPRIELQTTVTVKDTPSLTFSEEIVVSSPGAAPKVALREMPASLKERSLADLPTKGPSFLLGTSLKALPHLVSDIVWEDSVSVAQEESGWCKTKLEMERYFHCHKSQSEEQQQESQFYRDKLSPSIEKSVNYYEEVMRAQGVEVHKNDIRTLFSCLIFAEGKWGDSSSHTNAIGLAQFTSVALEDTMANLQAPRRVSCSPGQGDAEQALCKSLRANAGRAEVMQYFFNLARQRSPVIKKFWDEYGSKSYECLEYQLSSKGSRIGCKKYPSDMEKLRRVFSQKENHEIVMTFAMLNLISAQVQYEGKSFYFNSQEPGDRLREIFFFSTGAYNMGVHGFFREALDGVGQFNLGDPEPLINNLDRSIQNLENSMNRLERDERMGIAQKEKERGKLQARLNKRHEIRRHMISIYRCAQKGSYIPTCGTHNLFCDNLENRDICSGENRFLCGFKEKQRCQR